MTEQFDCKLGRNKGGPGSHGVVVFWVCLAVVGGIVLAAHWPGLSARALMLDDDQYLVENRLVQNPSWASAKRFFTEVVQPSTVRGYYQPLAMMSLMVDCAIGGGVDNLKPFHRTSLALHIANSLLVIVFLYLLFGRAVPAAVVGLLYGVHPATIESVAWVSERKTVLAAFFALWSLVLYVHYVRRGRRRYAWGCLVMYVLSLLSKPAIVAMPFLLLFLDFWPLRRLSRKAVLEKVPLFIISGAAMAVTFISQSRAASVTLPSESGVVRVLLTVCHNIIFYLYNVLWPTNLSWYYPFPQPFDLSQPKVLFGVIGTCVLIPSLLISLRWTKCLLTGWLFFFAAILPTLGIIGIHPMIAADRHLYFPVVGFLLPVGFLLAWFWDGEPGKKLGKAARRSILIGSVVFLGASEFILTRCYLVYWRDSESVYKYMLDFSPDVVILHNNLGNVLKESSQYAKAVEHFEAALRIKPNNAEIHNNLAGALGKLGRTEEEIEHYRKALELKPKFAVAHYNLATVFLLQGRMDKAIAEYKKAVKFQPDYVEALSQLGFALSERGDLEEAVGYYKKALAIEPGNIIAHGRLGLALASLGRIDEAIREFHVVLSARPDDAEMHFNVGVLLERQGKTDEAIEAYKRSLTINPNQPKVRARLEAVN